jgi:hypothetical protein
MRTNVQLIEKRRAAFQHQGDDLTVIPELRALFLEDEVVSCETRINSDEI